MPRCFRPDKWDPPDELLAALRNPMLTHADRVELIVATHAAQLGGNSPSYQTIADTLSLALERNFWKADAQKYVNRLIAQRRATTQYGKVWLVYGHYTHPLVSSQFPQLA